MPSAKASGKIYRRYGLKSNGKNKFNTSKP